MPRKQSLTKRVDELLASMEKHLNGAANKASVSDYMRLVQFRQQLAEEKRPREIKITWSETLEKYDTEE
ncbi:MAG: hypothetical protein ACR2NN_23740 [Bryobacteraceae bacterium]